jgi:tryptophanyl-tRNA synthetase
MRATYEALMRDPARIEAALLAGARKARSISMPFMAKLRHAVGLRGLAIGTEVTAQKTAKTASASFKQYREKDGKFYFKLVDTNGGVVLQSLAFESPKVAGQSIVQLQQHGASALEALASQLEPVADAAALAYALASLVSATD